MSNLKVSLLLPAFITDFTASYSHVDKPNGIQFILLTIIGTKSFRESTWKEIFERMRISEDVFDAIFKPMLGRMILLKMITSSGSIEFDDYIGDLDFTEVGRQAFEKEVITQDQREISGTVAYRPAAFSKKYQKASAVTLVDMGAEPDRLRGMEPDPYGIENHVQKEKIMYGVEDSKADVFDIKLGASQIGRYRLDATVGLDESTGVFYLNSNDLDPNFIKSYLTVDEILTKDSDDYSISSMPIYVYLWSEDLPDWPSISFMIPRDVSVSGDKITIVNNTRCNVGGAVINNFLKQFDLVSIKTSESGFGYRFSISDMSVSGIEGSTRRHIAVRKLLDKTEIDNIIEFTISCMDLTDVENLKTAIDMYEVSGKKESIGGLVHEYLIAAESIPVALGDLFTFQKSSWYRLLPEILEEVLLETTNDERQVEEIVSKSGVKISGTILATRLSVGDPYIDVKNTDRLLPYVIDPISFIRQMHVTDAICDIILDGAKEEYMSDHFLRAKNASRALRSLKSILGIRSLSEYSIDITNLTDEETVLKEISTLIMDMEKLHPIVKEAGRYHELESYESFILEIRDYLTKNSKSSDRLFAITLCIEVDDILEGLGLEGTLDEKLREGHDKGLISDTEFNTLDELREFRNTCAHELTIPDINKKKKDSWTKAVQEIRPKTIKGGSE